MKLNPYLANTLLHSGHALKKMAYSAIDKVLDKVADRTANVIFDHSEMIISIVISSILVTIVICLVTGNVSVAYLLGTAVANTIIDVSTTIIATAIMQEYKEKQYATQTA